ncbi:uncharacterized protein KY384_008618 [Bacidia gigantensis]|uniref:uncharacterized protein n=1 Tax=Bacidia gigantensis TaxID=2732470 RepID=UPI001D044372|nr:uncharacterized protein KY384_008618 [Bacidia gigantensis]KAG8527188.1 hypothetical protein KY384_008618 [Bacidia gigantensis]
MGSLPVGSGRPIARTGFTTYVGNFDDAVVDFRWIMLAGSLTHDQILVALDGLHLWLIEHEEIIENEPLTAIISQGHAVKFVCRLRQDSRESRDVELTDHFFFFGTWYPERLLPSRAFVNDLFYRGQTTIESYTRANPDAWIDDHPDGFSFQDQGVQFLVKPLIQGRPYIKWRQMALLLDLLQTDYGQYVSLGSFIGIICMDHYETQFAYVELKLLGHETSDGGMPGLGLNATVAYLSVA